MEKRHVYVVDDDAAVRRMLKTALDQAGLNVRTFEDGLSFLEALDTCTPGVVLLDLRMPNMGGLEVLRFMDGRARDFPVLIVSSHGDVSIAVKAVRSGALDFIEKPVSMSSLLGKIEDAYSQGSVWDQQQAAIKEAKSRLRSLTPREYEVGLHIPDGLANKEVASQLGLSPRTVEAHRAKLMSRLGVKTSADVIRTFLLGRLDS